MVECAGHKRPYRSSEADALALTDFTFGLDIVLFVIPLIYATRSQHHVLARARYREGLRLRQEMHQVEQIEERLVGSKKLTRVQMDALWTYVGHKGEKGGNQNKKHEGRFGEEPP